jgi:hypothetical protein
MKATRPIQVLFENKYFFPGANITLAVGQYQQTLEDGLKTRSIAICHWKEEGFENDLMVASCRMNINPEDASKSFSHPLFNAINLAALSKRFGFHSNDMKRFVFNLMSSNDHSKIEM